MILRFAPVAARDASNVVFHPDQATEANDNGSFTVRFEAGGIDEMLVSLHLGQERDDRKASPPSPALVARGRP